MGFYCPYESPLCVDGALDRLVSEMPRLEDRELLESASLGDPDFAIDNMRLETFVCNVPGCRVEFLLTDDEGDGEINHGGFFYERL